MESVRLLLCLFLLILGFTTSVAVGLITHWFFIYPVVETFELQHWRGFAICCSTFSFVVIVGIGSCFSSEGDNGPMFIVGGMVPILCCWVFCLCSWISTLYEIRMSM